MLKIDFIGRYSSPKIISLKRAAIITAKAKAGGKTVGLCHGGFDLLHPGHITHFESAKKACDILIVSVTSDKYVSIRKGDGRPIFSDKLRAYAIASLVYVDFVVITDAAKAIEVIEKIQPSFYIKGPDFINKKTPGIEAERKAIAAVGGKIIYTNDPKLSTTEIIGYIKKYIPDKTLLVITDRDGTLVEDSGFLGKSKQWKKELILNQQVASFLSFLKNKYDLTVICVSNQSGVARGYFFKKTVEEINREIARVLEKFQVRVAHWEYCPEVDEKYAAKHPDISWEKTYVKKQTRRKPATAMVDDALAALKLHQTDFKNMLVLGNSDDDQGLAKNLTASYLDVSGKTYDDLVAEFEKIMS